MADRHLPNARRPRQFFRNDRLIDDIDAEECRRRYRFTPDNIDRLLGLVGHRLQRQTRRNHALTPRQCLCLALRFYATGAFLQIVGDSVGVDIATVSRVVTLVTDCLFDLKDLVIRFPTTNRHKQLTKDGFHAIAGFPSVISAVDGTHIRIIAPHNYEENYVNRKHYHSINVQALCDHRGKSHIQVSKIQNHLKCSQKYVEEGLPYKFIPYYSIFSYP